MAGWGGVTIRGYTRTFLPTQAKRLWISATEGEREISQWYANLVRQPLLYRMASQPLPLLRRSIGFFLCRERECGDVLNRNP